MANAEIKLDPEALRKKLSAVLNQKENLTMKAGGACSGSSVAMNEFISAYDTMRAALKEYQALLNTDMQNISTIISRMEEQDRKEAEGLRKAP